MPLRSGQEVGRNKRVRPPPAACGRQSAGSDDAGDAGCEGLIEQQEVLGDLESLRRAARWTARDGPIAVSEKTRRERSQWAHIDDTFRELGFKGRDGSC